MKGLCDLRVGKVPPSKRVRGKNTDSKIVMGPPSSADPVLFATSSILRNRVELIGIFGGRIFCTVSDLVYSGCEEREVLLTGRDLLTCGFAEIFAGWRDYPAGEGHGVGSAEPCADCTGEEGF
jgi:hypothetical protein